MEKPKQNCVKSSDQCSSQHLIAEKLRQLSRLYVVVQKYRNMYGNTLKGKVPFLDSDPEEQKVWSDCFDEKLSKDFEMEGVLIKKINKLLPQHPWSEWLLSIKGVGPTITASIIGELDGAIYGSIKKGQKVTKADLKGYGRTFESTADLWSYAGYGVKDGKAAKRTVGEACSHNKYLKLVCYKFIENQIKQGEEYRKIYDERKKYERVNHSELTKMHIENRTKRYVIKKFLSDIHHKLILNDYLPKSV